MWITCDLCITLPYFALDVLLKQSCYVGIENHTHKMADEVGFNGHNILSPFPLPTMSLHVVLQSYHAFMSFNVA